MSDRPGAVAVALWRRTMLELLLPVLNLAIALVLSGVVVALIGVDPWEAAVVLAEGAFGYGEAVGYTLFYTTSFIFAGLAVAIAFHAGHFNIGGEGQATLGGLAVGLVALAMPGGPWWLVALVGVAAAAGFGAAWAFVPGWLQATRGSHIVITTIMFNFIAASLITWLMVDVLVAPGQQSPESAEFAAATWLPSLETAMGWLGLAVAPSPANLSLPLALVCCGGMWLLLERTSWGYAVRTVGASPRAATYAGISAVAITVSAVTMAGAMAGLVGVNEILGTHHKLLLGYPGGVGYVGIAVALMGRNHPLGVALAALLFGALYQGGSELAFTYSSINRELVVVIQGLVVMCTGSFENLFRGALTRLLLRAGGTG